MLNINIRQWAIETCRAKLYRLSALFNANRVIDARAYLCKAKIDVMISCNECNTPPWLSYKSAESLEERTVGGDDLRQLFYC